MRFNVGQRVRVVSDELDDDFVGAVGRISETYEGGLWPYVVVFDQAINGDNDHFFSEDEIVAVGVKVIEGEISEVGGEWLVGETNLTLLPWTNDFPDVGKRVRITIEEVDA